jgi:ATP-binding cassette subfamily C (CFTR/MRP) protein 1
MSKRHPLETSFWLTKLNNFWTFREMAKTSRNGTYTQEDHYDLPDDDRVLLNKNLVYGKWKEKGSLTSTVWSLFWGRILGLGLLYTIYQLLQQASAISLGLIVAQLTQGRINTQQERYELIFKCAFISLSHLIGQMVYNFACFYGKRLGLRMATAISLIVFEKTSRVNIMNKSEHTSGNIMNYIQIDCDRFFTNLPRVLDLYSCSMQLGVGIGVIYYQINWIAFIILGVSVIGLLIMLFFYHFKIINMDNLMHCKDNRVATLTNVINNIKFVKMKGWENYFQYKVSVKRDLEINSLFKIACFNGVELFVMWVNHGMCLLALVFSMSVFSPSSINLAAVSSCLTVLFINFEAIIMFPWYAGAVIDFKISLARLTKYLKFEEISYAHIKDDPKVLKDYGVHIEKGYFHWNAVKSEDDVITNASKKDGSNMSHSETLLDSSVTDHDERGFRLSGINFKARKGELVFIIGKIGCGKSSLLYAIMGEMPRTEEDGDSIIYRESKAAMLSQTPWLLGSTIKANILLDKPFDQELFDKALRLSQLADDVKEMPNGINTFIGENGSTVSGGQRTRIGLARCIYQDPELYILDDPLSALDLKVADKIMREGINGELKGKTRIIATHAIHNLKYADYIYVLDQGKVAFEGTFGQIVDSPIYQEFKAVTDDYATEEIEDPEEESPEIKPSKHSEPTSRRTTMRITRQKTNLKDDFFNQVMGKNIDPKIKENDRLQTEPVNLEPKEDIVDRLFMEEDKEQGKLSLEAVRTALKEIGGLFPIFMIIVACFIMVALNIVIDVNTLKWAQFFDPLDKYEYIWFIGYCVLVRCLMTIIRSVFVFGTQLIMSRQLHARMLFRVLHAKIGDFLERVPAGRIINRFTKDIEIIDKEIGWALSGLLIEAAGVCIGVGVLIWSVHPILAVPVFIFIITGITLQRKLMGTKREIVRLEAVSRSPIMTCVTGLLKGAPEIRVLDKSNFVKEEYVSKLEEMQKNNLLIAGLDHWYMNQINMINILMIQLPGFSIIYYIIVYGDGTFPLEKLVLFVLKSLELGFSLMIMLMNFSMLETQFISIERCSKFSKIEPEEHYLNFAVHERKYLHPNKRETIVHIMREMAKNEKSIITKGKVHFLKVTARYPTKPTPVLNSLTLAIKAGEKIGIVGRTGAGKTSLIKLFWMCLQPSDGKLVVDDRDVSKVDLKVLRSNIDIISQETAIFEGTLRENLDPKLEYLYDKNSEEFRQKDKELLQKLYDIGFKEEHLDGKGLDFMISANGDNLSLGQKQLLCFMRVLIDPKKLMILDEATANIDLKTEKLMQDAVRHEFKQSTMFIIAHRIQTVLECDKICLMEYGKVAEFGTPKELIRRPGSKFGEIYKKLKENISGSDELS